MKITEYEIERRIKNIAFFAREGMESTAHQLEDDLFLETLREIASGECLDAIALAKATVKSANLKFNRWSKEYEND